MTHDLLPTPWFGSAVANSDPHSAPANGMPAPPPSVTIVEVITAIPANSVTAHDGDGKAAAQKGAR